MSPELRGYALAHFIARRQDLNSFIALGLEKDRATMYDRFIAELTAPAEPAARQVAYRQGYEQGWHDHACNSPHAFLSPPAG